MTVDSYNAFCAGLPFTSHVVQWGGADVWKVSGKVFAIARWNEGAGCLWATFKVSPVAFEMLKEMPGLRPAPYLASRGMKWIQRIGSETMDDAALCDALADSHALVIETLPKRRRLELGLLTAGDKIETGDAEPPKATLKIKRVSGGNKKT